MDKSKIVLSYHAISRFRERSGAKYDEERIIKKLFELIDKSEEAQLRPRFKVIHLLNHNFEEAEYLMTKNGWVLVIVKNELKTIHTNQSEKWEKNVH